jgi:hypothetical protein
VDYTGPKAVFEGIELEYVPRPLRLFLVPAKKKDRKENILLKASNLNMCQGRCGFSWKSSCVIYCTYVYIHTYMYIYIHTCIYTYIHATVNMQVRYVYYIYNLHICTTYMYYIYAGISCSLYILTIYTYYIQVLHIFAKAAADLLGLSLSSWSLSLFLVSLSLCLRLAGMGTPRCAKDKERAEERAGERAREHAVERAGERAGSVRGSVGEACGSAHRLIIRAEKEKRARINCTKKPKLLRIAQDE